MELHIRRQLQALFWQKLFNLNCQQKPLKQRSHLNNEAIKYRDNIKTAQNLTYNYQSQEVKNKLRSELHSKWNEINFNTGISIDDVHYKNDTYQQDYQYNTPVQIFYNSRLSFIKYGIFASAEVPIISKRINLSMSFRMDANSYSNSMNNMLKQFSPRFSASAQLTTPLFFNFNLGRYYKLPSLTTMGYRDNNLNLTNKNNELKYIHADHVVAGFEYRPNNYSKITAEGFFKNYNNYPISVSDSISLTSKGGDFGVVGDEEVMSKGRGKAYVFELMARQRSPKGLSFIAAYTFVRSEFTNMQGQHRMEPFYPHWVLLLNFNMKTIYHINSLCKKTTVFSVFDKKASKTRLSIFLKPRSLLIVNDCFKNENNAVFGVFLQRLNSRQYP